MAGRKKGYTMSEEHKKKIGEAMKGKIPKNIELLKSKANKFKKGQEAWNKGLKTGLIPKTAFKEGHKSWNTNMGIEKYKRITKRVNGKKRQLSHINFLKYNDLGMWFIPKGWIVHHIDLNPENNDISNLACIPRGIHSSLHNEIFKEMGGIC